MRSPGVLTPGSVEARRSRWRWCQPCRMSPGVLTPGSVEATGTGPIAALGDGLRGYLPPAPLKPGDVAGAPPCAAPGVSGGTYPRLRCSVVWIPAIGSAGLGSPGVLTPGSVEASRACHDDAPVTTMLLPGRLRGYLPPAPLKQLDEADHRTRDHQVSGGTYPRLR